MTGIFAGGVCPSSRIAMRKLEGELNRFKNCAEKQLADAHTARFESHLS
jgi:hypothetical protein